MENITLEQANLRNGFSEINEEFYLSEFDMANEIREWEAFIANKNDTNGSKQKMINDYKAMIAASVLERA